MMLFIVFVMDVLWNHKVLLGYDSTVVQVLLDKPIITTDHDPLPSRWKMLCDSYLENTRMIKEVVVAIAPLLPYREARGCGRKVIRLWLTHVVR
jgi:hypothetical protein